MSAPVATHVRLFALPFVIPFALSALSSAALAQMTALPAASFTDSVGVNLHLEYTDTSYYSRQSVVEAALKQLNIRHVRTRLLHADPNEVPQPTASSNSNATNTAALLSRAGVKGVLTGAAVINQLYQDTTDRNEIGGTNGWAAHFQANFDNADSAQLWWNAKAPGTTRIQAVEGVNEPNLARGGTLCTNWMSKAADFQWRMHQLVASRPSISGALRVAPSLVHSSPSLCKDSASQNPFVYLGRKTDPIGAGFTVAWNAGWVAPSSSDPVSAWFTAGPNSLASTVQVSNLHIYPPVKDTPESTLEQIFWTSGGIRKCGPPASPNEPVPSRGATGFSCSEHMARSRADGQRKPIYVTEAGYAVASAGVTDHSRGVYIPRMLLTNLQAGYARTYIYELMKGKPTQNDGFWLITDEGPKSTDLGFHALRRVLAAIGDGTLPTGTEAASQVNVSVTELGQPGVPADPAYPVKSMLFAERNGTLSLALWPSDKVASGTSNIVPPERRVRITLGSGVYKSFTLHPIDPESPVDIITGQLIAGSANAVDVVLTGGHAVVVKLR